MTKELEFAIQSARQDLIAFAIFNDPEYSPQRFHKQIADKLEKVATGEIKRLMIFMPPRHGKSRLATQLFPAWLLGKKPNVKIIVAGYGQDLPNHFSRNTMNIVKGPVYQSIFQTRTKTENVAHWETQENGYYHAVGVGGPITGFGADILILDDPVKNREEAESITVRQSVRDRYTSTFYTRKDSKDSGIVVIMTRWHVDDLAGRLIKQESEGGEKREKIIIPAINDGQAIRPAKEDMESLERAKNVLGVRDFAALYMQDPVLSTGSIFKPSDFRYFLFSDFEKVNGLNRGDMIFGVFIDPAFSTSKQSDDAVVIVAGRHLVRNELFVLDIYAATSAPSQTIDAMFTMAEKRELHGFRIDFISTEVVSINRDQTQFKNTIREEMSKRNKYYTIYEFNPRGKKEDRIKFQLEPLFNNHKCNFIKGMGDYYTFKKLEDQLTLFPSSGKDDVIDCLAQARQVFLERGKPKKSEQAPRTFFNRATGKLEYIK